MEVVSCSAVACGVRTECVKFYRECLPSPPSLRRTPPPVAATNVTSFSSWFKRNLPHSFWLSVEGEKLRGGFLCFNPVRHLCAARAPLPRQVAPPIV